MRTGILPGILAGLFSFVSLVYGQEKKTLTQEDYGKWQSIASADLSANGAWCAYQVSVQEDNDTLYVTNRMTNKLFKLEFASDAQFSKDNQWIASLPHWSSL